MCFLFCKSIVQGRYLESSSLDIEHLYIKCIANVTAVVTHGLYLLESFAIGTGLGHAEGPHPD